MNIQHKENYEYLHWRRLFYRPTPCLITHMLCTEYFPTLPENLYISLCACMQTCLYFVTHIITTAVHWKEYAFHTRH